MVLNSIKTGFSQEIRANLLANEINEKKLEKISSIVILIFNQNQIKSALKRQKNLLKENFI